MTSSRLDDMLRIYAEKRIAAEEYHESKRGGKLSDYMRDHYAREGAAHAWVAHDSYFVWERPVAEPYDQLREWVLSDRSHRAGHINSWADLEREATNKGIEVLMRNQDCVLGPFPGCLGGDARTEYWMCVAIVHQCLRERKEIL